jgi:hypothetical protein
MPDNPETRVKSHNTATWNKAAAAEQLQPDRHVMPAGRFAEVKSGAAGSKEGLRDKCLMGMNYLVVDSKKYSLSSLMDLREASVFLRDCPWIIFEKTIKKW